MGRRSGDTVPPLFVLAIAMRRQLAFPGGRRFAKRLNSQPGWVPEWLKGPVLKTGRRESVSWVRIPPHPPFSRNQIFSAIWRSSQNRRVFAVLRQLLCTALPLQKLNFDLFRSLCAHILRRVCTSWRGARFAYLQINIQNQSITMISNGCHFERSLPSKTDWNQILPAIWPAYREPRPVIPFASMPINRGVFDPEIRIQFLR